MGSSNDELAGNWCEASRALAEEEDVAVLAGVVQRTGEGAGHTLRLQGHRLADSLRWVFDNHRATEGAPAAPPAGTVSCL